MSTTTASRDSETTTTGEASQPVEEPYDAIAVVTKPLDVSNWVLPKCQMPSQTELEPVEKFITNAIRQKELQEEADARAKAGYTAVIDCIRKGKDSKMRYLLFLALRTSGPTLHQLTTSDRHSFLIHALMRVDPFRTPVGADEALYDNYKMADSYLHLLLALLSSNSVFLIPVLKTLWRLLNTTKGEFHGSFSKERTNRLYASIETVLKLCPRGHTELFPIIEKEFPYRNAPLTMIAWYTKQTITMVELVPHMRQKVIELLVEKALDIDVEIRINDAGHVSIEKDDRIKDDDAIFQIEINQTQPEEDERTKEPDSAEPKVDEMADKLDCLLYALFDWISVHIQKEPTQAKKLFDNILHVFESSILNTYKSKFTQFVVFVVCGLDPSLTQANDECDTLLYREFATHLINIVLDPYRAPVGRQGATCYLASFISRAKYVCVETACESVSVLLRWAETYIDTREKSPSLVSEGEECDAHALFFTVCQGAFYIMCFRGDEVIEYYQEAVKYHNAQPLDSRMDFEYPELEHIDISPQRWERLCSHTLAPLRFCLSSVREEFLDVAERNCLLRSDEIERIKGAVEADAMSVTTPVKTKRRRRSRGSLIVTPVTRAKKIRKKGGVGGIGQGSNPLDSFFPFDPFLLRRSHQFVDRMYTNWQSSNNDEMLDDETNTTSRQDDEDSLGDLSVASSAVAMSLASTAATSPPASTDGTISPPSVGIKDTQAEAWLAMRRDRASSVENGSW